MPNGLIGSEFTSDQWIVLLPALLMLIDILTGFLNAVKKKRVNSGKMRTGYFKKAGEIALLVVTKLLVVAIGMPRSLYGAVSMYIVATELLSVLENLSGLGVKIPKSISDILGGKEEFKE